MNEQEVMNDLVYSKSYLEDIIGKEVVSFSIPFNQYSLQIFNCIDKAGYKNIYFNSFYKSKYFPGNFRIIQRKQVFNITSIKAIDSYLNSNKYHTPIIDKTIQFCSNATIGLKHLL